METMKKELKIYYTGDKITAIGVDIDGRLEPVLIVNPLCKVEAYERNRMLVDMVNAYNMKLMVELTKREPKVQTLQVMPNFDTLVSYPDEIINKRIEDFNRATTTLKPKKGICVDVGCKGNPGKTEFRGIDIESGKVIFHIHIPNLSTNNIGEWLGAVEGLKYAADLSSHGRNLVGGNDYKCYTDSMTAISWVRQKKCKTKFVVTDEEQKKMIADAESWLRQYGGKAEKWLTHIWGEIPADFNRKSGAKGKRI